MGEGVDVAVLGLKVDARDFVQADAVLKSFTATSGQAERAAKGLEDASARAGRGAAERAAAEARLTEDIRLANQAMEQGRASTDDYAAAFEVARQEAERLGLSVSSDLGRSISEAEIAMATAQVEGQELVEVMREMGTAGESASIGMAKIEQGSTAVGSSGTRSAAGVGRLNQALISLLRQATGTSPAVGALVGVIGSFAIGTAMMVGVLAGLAAVAFAWRKITEDAREAKEHLAESREELERLIEVRRLGQLAPGGAIFETMQPELEQIELIRKKLAALAAGTTPGSTPQGLADLKAVLEKDLAEALEIVRKGFQLIDDEISTSRTPSRDAAIQLDAQIRLTAAMREGVEAHALMAAQIAREQAVREAITGSTEDQRGAAVSLTNEYHDQLAAMVALAAGHEAAAEAQKNATEEAKRAAEEAKELSDRLAEEKEEQRVLYEEARLGLRLQREELERMIVADGEGEAAVNRLNIALAGENAARALGIRATDEDREAVRKDAEEVERLTQQIDAQREAREKLKKAIEDQREADKKAAEDAAKAAEDAAEAYKNAWLHALGQVGAAIGGIGQKLLAIGTSFATGGAAGSLGALVGIGSLGVSLAGRDQDAVWLEAQRKQAEEANRAADALNRLAHALDEGFGVRSLRVQGRDAEADVAALRQGNKTELDQIAQSFFDVFGQSPTAYAQASLGPGSVTDWLANSGLNDLPPAIRTFLEAILIHEQELNALIQRQVDLEAERVAQKEFEAEQRGFGLDERRAALDEDPGAAAQARRDRETGQADEDLRLGRITPDFFKEWIDIIDREYNKAVERATQATKDAAAAEAELTAQRQFAEMQALRNLDLEIFRLQGNERAALDLQQLMRLDDAIHEGRSQEYLDKLALIDSLQDQALAQQMASRAAQQMASSVERQRVETERLLSVQNAPSGFTTMGTRQDTLTGRGVHIDNLTIQVQPGEDVEAAWDRLESHLAHRVSSGENVLVRLT